MSKKIWYAIFSILVFMVVSCTKEDNNLPDGNISSSEIEEIVSNISADSIASYIGMLQAMDTRFALAPNRKDVAIAIMNKFRSFGYTNARLDSFLIDGYYNNEIYSTWQYNVIASMVGNVYPDSIAIMGGHHDCVVRSSTGDPFTFAPGANDNASGVAVTLEVARVLKQVNFKPIVTIQFMTFAAEELGLYGSYDYAGKAYENSEKIKMMLNNDMVAYSLNKDSTNWQVNIMDYENSVSIRKTAQQFCTLYTKLSTQNDNTYQAYSDSYSFALHNFKAIFFITDVNDPNYHTPNDLAVNCDFKIAREVAKVNCALLVDHNRSN